MRRLWITGVVGRSYGRLGTAPAEVRQHLNRGLTRTNLSNQEGGLPTW